MSKNIPLTNEQDCGADRIRTGDPLVANQMLSQLSYSPVAIKVIKTDYAVSGPEWS